MTLPWLIAFSIMGMAGLVLLGCILLELRDQRITWMLRKSMRREWVKKEHEG